MITLEIDKIFDSNLYLIYNNEKVFYFILAIERWASSRLKYKL